jgi:hypothetical protein
MSDNIKKTLRKRPKVASTNDTNTKTIDDIIYKIPEFEKEYFISLLEPLYKILEGKESKSKDDVFSRECLEAYYDKTPEERKEEIKRTQKERALSMEMGYFHQNLMGSFKEWTNYGKGHITGCDIGKYDNSCVAEVKNNVNTMNSDSKKSVMKKLKKQIKDGKKAMLIIVNGDIKKKEEAGVIWISGREFYSELSGREDFMDDLSATMKDIFKKYKTYKSLIDSLKTL